MDIYCFYIISYINFIYITTVCRSYGADPDKADIVVIITSTRVRVAQVVVVRVHFAVTYISDIEVRVVRVDVHRTRSDYPTYMPYKDFIHPAVNLDISSIFSPNFKYLF